VDDLYRAYLKDRQKNVKRSLIGRFSDLVLDIFVYLGRRVKFLRSLILWAEQAFFSPLLHATVFETHKPDLLVVSSLGTFDYDQFLMREARKRRIPVVSVVLQWDNTTTRGMPGAIPDRVVAWTETMKKELIEINDISPEKIFIGGVAHYDHYYRDATLLSREELFNKLGLDINKKLIFFATKSPNGYAWNTDIAEIILQAIRDNKLIEPCQLVVRLHPIYYRRQNTGFAFQHFLDQFYTLKKHYKELVLNEPAIISKSLDYSMPWDEINMLASILKHSNVVINMFSTLNLEASIFDIPIVNICFEGNSYKGPKKARYNIGIDEVQTHNQRVIKTGGIMMVYDEYQLIEGINNALKDPKIGGQGRRLIRKNETGPFPGCAGEKIAGYLTGLLENDGK